MRQPASPRTQLRHDSPRCLEGLRCRRVGCDQRTRERKPYCSEHIHELPYVAELMQVLAERDQELERAQRLGARAVDVDGITAREIVLQLRLYGERTTARLARDLSLDEDVVTSYARALALRGWVSLGRTSRGVTLVTPEALDTLAGTESAA